ncbi:cell wall hydrolase [Bengtsoniella intestinalis]|uniref:cell wall hydrolase n=1 Tax=Bengtsoniella intestinalis TaxID=3073143 RepID=UPI00391F562D
MKKQIFAVATAAALTVSAHASRSVNLQIDGTTQPYQGTLTDGVTYYPMEPLLCALGDWTVTWDAPTATAMATDGTNALIANPTANTITYNQQTYPATVYIQDGTTYIPVRLVLNLQGGSAQWDGYYGGVAITSPTASYNAMDYYWLSRVISAESQGEQYDGQIAVGQVVVNRVLSDTFPHSIADVIFDTNYGTQFEPTANATIYLDPTASAQAAAHEVLTSGGSVLGDDVQYFYAPTLSQGTWIRANRVYYTSIGCHDFYL